jgi:glycosyltransferase involved in cell wall biosynthesis
MKVLVYTTLFPNHLQPNSAIFIKQRMFHFAKLKDCEIKVVAPIPYCPPWPSLGKWYHNSQIKKYEVMDGIEVYHPRYPLIPKVSMPLHGLSLFLSSLKLIKKINQTFPFDLIDGHYIYPDGFAAVLLGKTLKKPVVLSARGSDINQFTGFKSIKPMIQYALSRADHVISVCDALKQEMVALGINDDKISVIPNGVDSKQFYLVDKDKARKKLSLPHNKKIILSVGSLIPRKGFHVILDALPKLLQEDTNIRLYIVGEGPFRHSLERKIGNLGLDKHVTLMGEQPNSELKIWYSAADVFCLASFREGWANVIMESLACGTPVVATKVWGAPEILTSTDIGILVDRTPDALYNALKRALETTWDRKRIQAHVKDRNWFTVADEVKTLFGVVLDNHVHEKNLRQKLCL